jgi:hypothetical protein
MRVGRKIVIGGVSCALMMAGGLPVPGTARADSAEAAAVAPLVVKTEAESRTAERGTSVARSALASGGLVVGRVSDGDWLRFDDVAVTDMVTTFLCFSTTSASGTELGTVDVRLGSRWATPTTSIALRNNIGGSTEARQLAFGGPIPDGVHTVFLTVRQPARTPAFALDYVTAAALYPPPSLNC